MNREGAKSKWDCSEKRRRETRRRQTFYSSREVKMIGKENVWLAFRLEDGLVWGDRVKDIYVKYLAPNDMG